MIIYIKPLSLFPKLHSDTIFGAITYSYSILYPENIDKYIEDFNNNPPFLLSSAFPYANINNKKIRFYPKIITENKTQVDNIENLKKFKKINYLEEKIFLKFINGEITTKEIIENYDNYYHINDLLMTNNPTTQIKYSNNIIPNNTINRLDNTSEGIFYSEGTEFKNMGLFFELEFKNPKYKKQVLNCIKFLKDRGFGKDISTGKGQFAYETSEEKLNITYINTKYFITLSRYIPTKDELNEIKNNSKYEIVSKQGRSKNGEIRKKIRFFKEGSIFKNNKEKYGQIIDSGKQNPSLEYGYAYKIPYFGGENI